MADVAVEGQGRVEEVERTIAPPGTLDEAVERVQAGLDALGLRRTGEGEVTGQNKQGQRYSYKYKYLPYPDLLEKVRPLLIANRLTWRTKITTMVDGGSLKPALYYKLTFVPNGEVDDGTMLLMLDKETSQAQGSGATYARRQAFTAMLEITPDEDDDGKAASQPARPAPADPEAPLPEESVNAMLEAITERGLSVGRTLEAAGVKDGESVSVGDSRKVKALLDRHDAKGAGS